MDNMERKNKGVKRSWIVGLAIVAAAIIAWIIIGAVNKRAAAPRYLTAPVKYADINATIEETGTVIPVDEVDVGTQVSGTIATLSVDYNSIVHKGETLATLDPTSFEAATAQANAALNAADATAGAAAASADQSAASIRSADATAMQGQANADAAVAAVGKAQAQVALSHATIVRDQDLLSKGYISQSQMDTDTAANSANIADLRSATAALAAARAQAVAAAAQRDATVQQHNASTFQASAATAQSQAAQGQAQQADYNLSKATITSPIDGIVVSRAVSVGQTVAASFSTPTLFVIASSLKDMEVDVSVSEADVGQLKAGATASISVPAYPNVTFHGTVTQVRVNPNTVQNVVTYDAIVAVHDASARLKPGMTADVLIAISARKHVLVVPTAALLFKPAGQGGSSAGGAAQASPGTGPASATTPAPAIAGAPGSTVTVWTLVTGRPHPVQVVIGLTDGRNFEITSGDLSEGDRVIIGQLQAHHFSGGTTPVGGGGRFGG
jgi:HlyD family secretion protein